jgi:TRAP-type C4-dicarboxylate transport system permease small subunit
MVLRIFLACITIFASALFLYAGWLLRSKVVDEPNVGTMEKLTVTMIPVGAGLIIFHSLVQIVIEVDYLVRGKLSPERERMGH